LHCVGRRENLCHQVERERFLLDIGDSLDDHDRNMAVNLSGHAAPQIQAYGSRVRIFVTETAEQLMIARETMAAIAVDADQPGAKPSRPEARVITFSSNLPTGCLRRQVGLVL
jgi:hypothetical protein